MAHWRAYRMATLRAILTVHVAPKRLPLCVDPKLPHCACCRMVVRECLICVAEMPDEVWLCANCKASREANDGHCWHERLMMPTGGISQTII